MTDAKTRSADELIFQEESRKLGKPVPEVAKPEVAEPVSEEVSEEVTKEPDAAPTEEASEPEVSGDVEPEKVVTSDADSDTDEYGTPINKKEKTYTQAEVQEMIRDRLSRGRNNEQQQQTQQQAQEAARDFNADPDSDETWETQLGNFVEKKIAGLAARQQQDNWRKQEELTQQEFEDKFSMGMSKYGDFSNVVSGKPISNSMMMATRSMKDPAAFLYAACKQHPAELERIAKIPDSYAQVAEIGRLEERMKRARVIPKGPAPSRKISGDATSEMPKFSIDELINSHAKSKIVNNRK